MSAWRRSLRWILLLGAVTLGLALSLSVWLVRSDGGRDWLLARAIAVLPSGATLHWRRIEGSLSGPLEIHDMHFDYQGTSFDARRLHVDHGFWPLLSGRLDIHSLTLEHALLVLPPAEPLELPRWPDVLPRLNLPITVDVDHLQGRDWQIRQAAQSLAKIASIDAGFTASRGALRVRNLVLASDRGWLRGSGVYLPRDRFQTALSARLVFPALPGAAPAQATLTAKGDLDDFVFQLEGRAPAPLSVRLRLRDGDGQAHWLFDASSAQLQPELLGLPADLPYAFNLHATSESGAARVQGRVVRGDLAADIAPSRMRLDRGVITVAPLALTLEQGPVILNGTLALDGDTSPFDLRVQSPGLTLSPHTPGTGAATVTARGDLRVRGRWQAWTIAGDATLVRAAQQATVTLAGRGDTQHLTLDKLLAKTPNGQLRGVGELHWAPLLGATLTTELSGFDPGYFFPDYPGTVSGRLNATGERDAQGHWRGQVRLADLRGRLRNRPVQGQAAIQFANDAGTGTLSLRIGDSRIEAGGRYGPQVDLHAQFSPLDLADLWPDAGGRVHGRIAVRGARVAPAYDADLTGADLHWGGLAIRQLSAKGVLPANARDGDLRFLATDATLAGQKFDSVSLELTGGVAAFRARAKLAGDNGSLSAEATASGSGDRWQGHLEQLQLAPRQGLAWHLQSAAAYHYHAGAVQLDRACLVPASAAGQVCAQATGEHATLAGRGLPLALLEPWLADSAMRLRPFGVIDFDGALTRESSGSWGGQAQLRSAGGGLRIDPQSPHETLSYSDLQLDLHLQQAHWTLALAARLPEGGTLTGQAQSGLDGSAPLLGELHLDVRQLNWLELLSTDLAAPDGQLAGTLLLGGQLDAPALSGDARLSGFSAELPALGVKLRAGEFALHGAAGGQARLSGQVTSGSGQLTVDGSLDLADRQSPLKLTLRGENITVANTPDLDATMSPDLQLQYADGTLQIRGVVVVPSARVDLERLDQSVSPSPDVVVLDPRQPTSKSVFLVDTEIELRLGQAVRLRGFGLDGTLGGSLQLRDRPGHSPRASGTLEVAGNYSAYGRLLEIKRGRLTYVNSTYDNPALDILAEHEFDEVTVGVRVRGSALAPETTVTSTPAMATAEALAWLVLGRPLSSASGTETEHISASALALDAGTNLLAQQIGSRLGLDTAGISESRTLGSSTLLLGKQISPRWFVSYGVSLLTGGQVLVLKYLMAHGLNASIESGTIENAASLNWRKEK